MARACTICEHPDRDSIDAALVCCESQKVVAERYGVGKDAVRRHRLRHLSPALAAMQVEREQADKTTALEEIRDIISSMKRILAAAEQEGKPTLALSAAAGLGAQIERLAKLTGEWRDQQPIVTFNLLSSPEILAALNVVYSELVDHPDVRQRIAARLQPERLQLEAGPS